MEGKIAQSELTTEGKIDTKIGVVEGEIGTIGTTIVGIQDEIAALVAGLEIGSLVELGMIIDLIALNGDVTDLESDLDDLWDAIGNLDNRLEGYEEDFNEIHTQLDNLNIPPDFTEDIENINNRLDSFEEDITDINNKLDNFEEDITDINNKLDTFEKDITDINNKLDTFEKDISEINNKLDAYEEDKSDLQSQINNINTPPDFTEE
jgi:chromosome segregation ATPase